MVPYDAARSYKHDSGLRSIWPENNFKTSDFHETVIIKLITKVATIAVVSCFSDQKSAQIREKKICGQLLLF